MKSEYRCFITPRNPEVSVEYTSIPTLCSRSVPDGSLVIIVGDLRALPDTAAINLVFSEELMRIWVLGMFRNPALTSVSIKCQQLIEADRQKEDKKLCTFVVLLYCVDETTREPQKTIYNNNSVSEIQAGCSLPQAYS